MPRNIVAITTGDLDGIGLEVSMKALGKIEKTPRTPCFIVLRGKKTVPCWRPLPKKLTLQVSNWDEAIFEAQQNQFVYIEVESQDSPAEWVKRAATECVRGRIHGMVTGPVSKKTFMEHDLACLGHTPLLQKVCQTPHVYMGFLGQFFNVVLLTGHSPLSSIETKLSPHFLSQSFQTFLDWRQNLPLLVRKKPLGVLGLNPHSGEDGLIGTFENEILTPIINQNSSLQGPLVPDAAFFGDNWKSYSFYVSLYHDQGLIPFKMIHGHSGGTHVTIGLPIIRTSVDHGTATNLYGKGVANAGSMFDAIQWCSTLIRQRHRRASAEGQKPMKG